MTGYAFAVNLVFVGPWSLLGFSMVMGLFFVQVSIKWSCIATDNQFRMYFKQNIYSNPNYISVSSTVFLWWHRINDIK